MKYAGLTKLEMLGELVLIGNEKALEIGKSLYHHGTAEDLRALLVAASYPPGTDPEEPDAETGRF